MGGHSSKKTTEASPPAGGYQPYANELSSYRAACKLCVHLQTFDKKLQARTKHVINTLAGGAEERAVSFDSLKVATECLLQTTQEAVEVILGCKEDVWNNPQLSELVYEYFNNSLQIQDFYNALGKCLQRARHNRMLMLAALQQFEEETDVRENRYVRTLKKLKSFKAAGDPFTEEFIWMFQSVYKQQNLMLQKLRERKSELDKRCKRINVWRKVSSMILMTTVAVLLICSVVAVVMAAPPRFTEALTAATYTFGCMGECVDSLWKNYEDTLKWQKDVISSMEAGNYVAKTDLDDIRVLIDRLEIDIEALLQNADVAIEEGSVKIAIEEIKKRLEVFMKNAEDLEARADLCRRHIAQARIEVLQRII